jgi:hypothetical protein
MCGVPLKLARDPDFAVRFDRELNEYSLSDRDGRVEHLMRFCFWCGGSLPESRRDQLFCEMSASETEEVQALLKGPTNVSDVVKALGPPDGEVEPDNRDATRGVAVPFSRQMWYRQRWKTLDLFVNVLPDGNISFAVTPKVKSADSEDAGENG